MRCLVLGKAAVTGMVLLACTYAPASVFGNQGFESPALTTNLAVANPSNATWTFSPASGIANGASDYGTGGHSGSQYAFLQSGKPGNAAAIPSVSQTVGGFTVGRRYRIAFTYAGCNGTAGNVPNTIRCVLNGKTVVSVVTPATTTWHWGNSNVFTASQTTNTIRFEGLKSAQNKSTLIDDIQIYDLDATVVYDGGHASPDQVAGSIVDPVSGNLYVMSRADSNGVTYFEIRKFNTASKQLARIDQGFALYAAFGAMTVDHNGNMWYAINEPFTGGTQAKLFKMSPAGKLIVGKIIPQPQFTAFVVQALTTDSANNLYAAVQVTDSQSKLELIKFTPSGVFTGAHQDTSINPAICSFDSGQYLYAVGGDTLASNPGGARCVCYSPAGGRQFTMTRPTSTDPNSGATTSYNFTLQPGPVPASPYFAVTKSVGNPGLAQHSFYMQHLRSNGTAIWTKPNRQGACYQFIAPTENDVYVRYGQGPFDPPASAWSRLTSTGSVVFDKALPYLQAATDNGTLGSWIADQNLETNNVDIQKLAPNGTTLYVSTVPEVGGQYFFLYQLYREQKSGGVYVVGIAALGSNRDVFISYVK